MIRYKNLSGNSGVTAYELGSGFILVEFVNGGLYRYTYASTGSAKIEEMKKRAGAGRGLSAYISQEVRGQFDKKIR